MLPPVPQPKPVDGKKPNVLWIHWNNVVKANGNCKYQSCLNGYKHATPWLRQFVQTLCLMCGATLHASLLCPGYSSGSHHHLW